MNLQERSSNLELLRIFAILAIIAGHFSGELGITDTLTGLPKFFFYLLSSASRISVNVFVIIGAYFLVDLDFSAMRPLRLYGTLIGYSLPITLLMLFIGEPINYQQLMQGILPFSFIAAWYATAYIAYLFFTPYLRKILDMPKSKLRGLVILILVFICGLNTMPGMSEADFTSDMLWFPCIYIIVGYLKKHTPLFAPRSATKYLCAAMAIMLYLAIVLAKCHFNDPRLFAVVKLWQRNIKSLPNVIIAMSVFVVFLNIRIGHSKIINTFAKTTFAVYVIHQIPAFTAFQWRTLISLIPVNTESSISVVVAIVLPVTTLYITYSVLDLLRIWLIAPRLLKSSFVYTISKRIDHFFISAK